MMKLVGADKCDIKGETRQLGSNIGPSRTWIEALQKNGQSRPQAGSRHRQIVKDTSSFFALGNVGDALATSGGSDWNPSQRTGRTTFGRGALEWIWVAPVIATISMGKYHPESTRGTDPAANQRRTLFLH